MSYGRKGILRSLNPFLCGAMVLTMVYAGSAQDKVSISTIVRTYRDLRAFSVSDEIDAENHIIPPRIRRLQTRFKNQLRGLIVGILSRDMDSVSRPPLEIQVALRDRFEALRLITRSKEHLPFISFGHVLDVLVSRPAGHQDFLAVELVIDAGWDRDESLYILRNQNSGWVNVLAAEVNDYSQVWDAQSSRFNYAISPPAKDGSWFLVTSSVNPHMASAWQLVTYTVLAPSSDADHPHVLIRRTHSIYLDREDEGHACRISVAKSGFGISFIAGFRKDPPLPEWFSDEYRVSKHVATRVAVRCHTKDNRGRRIVCSTRDYLKEEQSAY